VLTVTLALAAELSKRHDVELVSLYGGGEAMYPLPRGVPVRELVSSGGASLWRRLTREVSLSERPSKILPETGPRYAHYSEHTDVVLEGYLRSVKGGAVVTMQPMLNIALARLGTDRYVKVAQDHRPYVGRPQSVLDMYQEYGGSLDAFLALTRRDANRYRPLFEGKKTLVRRMTNGTPAWDGDPSTLTSKVVVAAGRLEPSKGFDLLVETWRQVADAHPDWRLRIFGEGSMRADLEQQIADVGLIGRVTLEGHSTSLQSEMAKASLFVLSSRAEGYGMVLVEAMACGVPVVSTDCPTGPRDIITPGLDGILVPNKDVDALARAVNEVIELDHDARLKMGAAARAKAEERSQSSVADEWDTLLTNLDRKRRRK
jgi:glycosyltransferase involved in cell wall biosynthesis